jgi:hypothetical protein
MKKTGWTAWFLLAAACSPPAGTPLYPAFPHDPAGPHHGPGTEIGASLAWVRLDTEGESAAGVHLHLMRRPGGGGAASRLGLGMGLEGLFGDHSHHGIMGSIGVFPWKGLALSLSPTCVLTDHGGKRESGYATHVEAAHGFAAGRFDVGPVAAVALSEEDRHYMVGLHVGWDWGE